MELAVVYTRAEYGIEPLLSRWRDHLSRGFLGCRLRVCRKLRLRNLKYRVRAAILNSRFEFPQGRITLNFVPANIPMRSRRYDLTIAIGSLVASGQVKSERLSHSHYE